jgi:hypothetical protein
LFKRILKTITGATDLVSSFADFICFKKINKYLAVGYEGQIARDGALGGRWKV